MWRIVWVVLGAALVGGCEGKSCTLVACGGQPTALSLVNEQGEPMFVEGETRGRGPTYQLSAEPFDCTRNSPSCQEGVLRVSAPNGTEDVLELRFRLPDGGYTEWQTLELDVSSHTDPDFNGLDCPCTSYEAAPLSVVVPEAAQAD